VYTLCVLLGDSNNDTQETGADMGYVKENLFETVDGTNFRADVNVDNQITGADMGTVKENLFTTCP
jgi:hypothetical protein